MRARRALAGAVTTVVVAASLAPLGGPAGAATDGGASSRVTRDGRIVTTILFGGTVRARRGGTAATTWWLTLTDAELAFVLELLAARPELADVPLVRALSPHLADGVEGAVDVQLLVRDGTFTGDVRVVPSTPGTARALARRMITELPSLVATVSPPADAVVVVGEPVFVSFPTDEWDTVVDRSITAGGVTARVRARPVRFRLSSGDPASAGSWRTCDGPGRPFDPDDPASPAAQARRRETCAVTYRTATGLGGRRDRWYGDHTVIWRAEWTTDGTTWLSLGEIPRITLFTRRVRTVGTTIEAPAGPVRTAGSG